MQSWHFLNAAEFRTLLELALSYGWQPVGTTPVSAYNRSRFGVERILSLDIENDSASMYLGHPSYGSYFIGDSSIASDDAQRLAICLDASRGRVPEDESRDDLISWCVHGGFEISVSEREQNLPPVSWRKLSRKTCTTQDGREFKISELLSKDDFVYSEGQAFVTPKAIFRVAASLFGKTSERVKKIPPPDSPEYLRVTYTIGEWQRSKDLCIDNETARERVLKAFRAETFKSALGLQIPILKEHVWDEPEEFDDDEDDDEDE